jgi:hypothetical protein
MQRQKKMQEKNLECVLQQIQENMLILNEECEFGMTELTFLVHSVMVEGCCPTGGCIQAI